MKNLPRSSWKSSGQWTKTALFFNFEITKWENNIKEMQIGCCFSPMICISTGCHALCGLRPGTLRRRCSRGCRRPGSGCIRLQQGCYGNHSFGQEKDAQLDYEWDLNKITLGHTHRDDVIFMLNDWKLSIFEVSVCRYILNLKPISRCSKHDNRKSIETTSVQGLGLQFVAAAVVP